MLWMPPDTSPAAFAAPEYVWPEVSLDGDDPDVDYLNVGARNVPPGSIGADEVLVSSTSDILPEIYFPLEFPCLGCYANPQQNKKKLININMV